MSDFSLRDVCKRLGAYSLQVSTVKLERTIAVAGSASILPAINCLRTPPGGDLDIQVIHFQQFERACDGPARSHAKVLGVSTC